MVAYNKEVANGDEKGAIHHAGAINA